MLLRTRLAGLAAVLIFVPASLAAAGPTAHLDATAEVRLVAQALTAAGIDDPFDRADERRKVYRAIDEAVSAMGDGRPTYRRAARLHRVLHRDHFRQYREDADGLHDVVANGDFNCLSATLFYGLVARELGYDVVVLEFPGHLLLGLEIDGRRIEVETTTPRGFDRPRDGDDRSPDGANVFRGIPGFGHPDASDDSADPDASTYWEVSLEQALGFAWLNAAWRSLEAGECMKAAKGVVAASRLLPDLSTQEENTRRLLSRASRCEYESGSFDDAYRIAAIETDLLPATTTSRDRLLAAAIKRVEDMCDLDAAPRAATVVDEVTRIMISGRDVARFERRAWPIVTAAAVRLADWPLAEHAANRYASVEPDPVEARRVVAWVNHRRVSASAGRVRPVCSEPDPSEMRIISH